MNFLSLNTCCIRLSTTAPELKCRPSTHNDRRCLVSAGGCRCWKVTEIRTHILGSIQPGLKEEDRSSGTIASGGQLPACDCCINDPWQACWRAVSSGVPCLTSIWFVCRLSWRTASASLCPCSPHPLGFEPHGKRGKGSAERFQFSMQT